MEKRELTCICCPLGCALTVEIDGGEVKGVTGNGCKQGAEYGPKEVTNPTRIVTSSVPVTGSRSDMSGYEGITEENNVFYDLTVREMADYMGENRTFAVYLGFKDCSWCREAVPLINRAASEAGMEVGYIDTRKDPSWKKNTDIADYDLLIEKLGEYIEFDTEGTRHLYTPDLYIIQNGRVIAHHEGTTPNHNADVRKMSQEESNVLLELYRTMFNDMAKSLK